MNFKDIFEIAFTQAAGRNDYATPGLIFKVLNKMYPSFSQRNFVRSIEQEVSLKSYPESFQFSFVCATVYQNISSLKERERMGVMTFTFSGNSCNFSHIRRR